MDLAQFDTREKAERGVDVPLVLNGEQVIGDDGKPVTFRVRGTASDDVADALLRLQDKPGRTSQEVRDNDASVLLVAIAGWSDNFVFSGEKLEHSPDAIRRLAEINSIRRALVREVMREANFTGKP